MSKETEIDYTKDATDFSEPETTKPKMKRFKVRIEETLAREVDIVAEDEEMALAQIEAQYYQELIVLDADDFTEVDFSITD